MGEHDRPPTYHRSWGTQQQANYPPPLVRPAPQAYPEPSAPPLQQPQHGQSAAFAGAPPNFQYPPHGAQQMHAAGDVEMQPQARPELAPEGGLTCGEVGRLVLLGVASLYIWFGLFVVLPVCIPKKCSESFDSQGQHEGCVGVCHLYDVGTHIPFIVSMGFAGLIYITTSYRAVFSVAPASVPLREWLAKSEECRGVSPYVDFFIECYHYATTVHGNESRRKYTTHTATETWQCTSSVDETTLPSLKDTETYRVVTAVKVVPGDQYTAQHLERASKLFFMHNKRDEHQDKVVSNFIPGLPAQLTVFGGDDPPLLLSRTWGVICALLLVAFPFKIYEYCTTTRAEVVFIKRVYRAPE